MRRMTLLFSKVVAVAVLAVVLIQDRPSSPARTTADGFGKPAGNPGGRETGVKKSFLAAAQQAIDRIQRTIFEPQQGRMVAVAKTFRAVFEPSGMALAGLRESKRHSISQPAEDALRRLDASWSWARVDGLESGLPALSKDAQTVTVDRGLIRETFENRSDGVEHTIIVQVRPTSDEALTVRIDVGGTLYPSKPDESDRIALLDPSGRERLEYKGLKAWDSSGRILAGKLMAHQGAILISIDDTGAAYPVTIDPVLAEPPGWAWSWWPGTPGEQFGHSVAMLGDLDGNDECEVAIGCPGFDEGDVEDAGALFIFEYDDSEDSLNPIPVTILMGPPDEIGGSAIPAQEGGRFGHSIASITPVDPWPTDHTSDGLIDIMIGSPGFDDTGACFFISYDPSDGTWGTAQVIYGTQEGSGFGWSVLIMPGGPDDFLIGAPFYDTDATDAGMVYWYMGGALNYPEWESSGDDEEDGLLGFSLGHTPWGALVGAPGLATSSTYGGKVFCFLESGSANPGLDQAWSVTGDEQAGAQFGYSVAGWFNLNSSPDLNAMEVIVGAPGFDTSHTDAGKVYVYLSVYLLSYIGAEPDWTSSGPDQEGARFGWSVASGDFGGEEQVINNEDVEIDDLVVGAPGYDVDPGSGLPLRVDAGAIVVFEGAAEGLLHEGVVLAGPQGGMAGAGVGFSLAVTTPLGGEAPSFNDNVFAGAPFADRPLETDDGLVCFFQDPLEGSGFTQLLIEPLVFGLIGSTLAIAGRGNVNGDAYEDVIVGAPGFDDGDNQDVGAAFVFAGSEDGLGDSPLWTWVGTQESSHFGTSVALVDLMGNGVTDAVVGAPDFDGVTDRNSGLVYVFTAIVSSPEAPFEESPRATLEGDAYGRRLGLTLAGAGRVNGSGGVADSYQDLLIGANNAAYVVFGPVTSSSGVDWSETGVSGGFGSSVACAGDVNADGFDDIIIGAPMATSGSLPVGAAYVYLGSDDGPSANPWIEYGQTLTSPFRPTRFGYSVAGVGDVNNDSFDDVLIGAPGLQGMPGDWAGRAYIHLGSSNGLSATADWTTDGPADNACYGWIVASAGDVDGDDIPDVLISSAGTGPTVGVVYLFLSVDGDVPDTDEESSASGSNPGATSFGRGGLAGVGDVNGDGFDDIMVGQAAYFDPYTGYGKVLLYYGGN